MKKMCIEDEDFEDNYSHPYAQVKICRNYHFGVRYDYASEPAIYQQKLLYLFKHPRYSRIYLLNFNFFFRALFSKKLKRILEESSLVLLNSHLLAWGIRVLSGKRVFVWTYAKFYETLVSFRDRFSLSFYFWGGTSSDVKTILKQLNAHESFEGSFLGGHQLLEDSQSVNLKRVFASLNKLHPHFLLLGEGFKVNFAYMHQKYLTANVILWDPFMFKLMAKRSSFERNYSFFKALLRSLVEFLKNPLVLFSALKRLFYSFIVIVAKVLGFKN